MLLNKKILKKLLSFVLAYSIALNPLFVPLVWAVDEEGLVEEEVIQEEVVEEPAKEAEVEEIKEEVVEEDSQDSEIITGDAQSEAEIETDLNNNQTEIPGELSVPESGCPPVEGETECSGCLKVEADNLADVDNAAASLATTSDNEIVGGAGDALIDTGEATAGAELNNQVNTNTVELEPSEEGDESDGEEESDNNDEETADPAVLVVDNDNEAEVENQADIAAATGDNVADNNNGDVTIDTGDAVAWANLLNILNTNIVGSNFEVLFLDLFADEEDVNLNDAWKEILVNQGADSLYLADGTDLSNLQLFVDNQNNAYLENNVDLTASSGENKADNNNGDATIETGDATALVNVTNFVNTNIVGASFFLGVINIFGDFDGNIVLPRPERFLQTPDRDVVGETESVVFENDNNAKIDDNLNANADTGHNQEANNLGDSLIDTGKAKAVANSFSWVDLNIFNNNWFFTNINRLGEWTGRVLGWSSASAVEEPDDHSLVYSFGLDGSSAGVGNYLELDGELSFICFTNDNEAEVKNNINVGALTGSNQANENEGDATIETGDAQAIANAFNFVNLNILGGKWFAGMVNVVGDWNGNLIFAHPDVIVWLANGIGEAEPGDVIEYTLRYKNQGYDEAHDVNVGLSLPQGLSYVSDTSGLSYQYSGNDYLWNVGTLGVSEEGSFTISLLVNPDFSFEEPEPISLIDFLVPKAHAAEYESISQSEVSVTASISTSDPESDETNNYAIVKTVVYQSSHSDGEEVVSDKSGLVELEITASNNVGDYIFAGDVITFEIMVENTGGAISYNTVVDQELFNGIPEEGFGQTSFEVGDLEPDAAVRLTFGLKLKDNGFLTAGHYYTIAQAYGESLDSNQVVSNQARTDFELRVKQIASLYEARAVEEEEREVLGDDNDLIDQSPTCDNEEDILPYVLLFLLSSLWLIEKLKRKFKGKELKDEN